MARNWGSRVAAGKIIGGNDFNSSIPTIRQLNSQGLSVTVDHLGEFVNSAEVARERTEECIQTIATIADQEPELTRFFKNDVFRFGYRYGFGV